jgi:hypothetical protein
MALETWIQVSLNDVFHCGRDDMNFYSHKIRKSVCSINILVKVLGRWATVEGGNLFCGFQMLSSSILSFGVG